MLPPGQFMSKYVFFTDPTYPTTNLVLTRVAGPNGFQDVTVDCLGTVGGWQAVGTSGKYQVTDVDLLRAAGISKPSCRTIAWDHQTSAQGWWHGAESGVGFIGHLVATQPPETRAEIKRHFDLLSAEFTGPDGRLALPHRALLASGTAEA